MMRSWGQIGLALFFVAASSASSFADTHSVGPLHASTTDLRPRYSCDTDLLKENLTAVYPWLAKKDIDRADMLLQLARAPKNPLKLRQEQQLVEIAISTLLCAKTSKLSVSTFSFLQQLEGDLDTIAVAARYGNLLSMAMAVERLLQLDDSELRRSWAEQLRQRINRERELAIDKPRDLASGQYTVPLSPALLRGAEAVARTEHDRSGNLPSITEPMLALAKIDGRDRALFDAAMHQTSVEDPRTGKGPVRDRVARLLEDRRPQLTALLTTAPSEENSKPSSSWNSAEKPLEIAEPSALTRYLEDSFKSGAALKPLVFKNLSTADRERMRASILAFLANVEQDKLDAFAGKKLSETERGKDRLFIKALLEHALQWLDRPSADHGRLVIDPPELSHNSVPWTYGELLKLEGEARRLATEKNGTGSALTDDFDAFLKWMNANVHGGVPAQTRIDFYRLSPEERRLFVRILEGALPADIPFLLPLVYHPTGDAILKHIVTERPHINLDPKDKVLPPAKFVQLARDYYEKKYGVKLTPDSKDLRDLRMRRYLLEEALEDSPGVKQLIGNLPHIEMREKVPGATTEAERYYGRELQRSTRNLTLLSHPEKIATLPAAEKEKLKEYLETRMEELRRTLDELDVNALHDEIWHRANRTGKPGPEEVALKKARAMSRVELGSIAQLLYGDKVKLAGHGTNPLLSGAGAPKLTLDPEYWEKFQLESDAGKREAQLKEIAARVKATPFNELAELTAYLKGGTMDPKFVQSELDALDKEEKYVRGEYKMKVYGTSLGEINRARQRLHKIQRLLKNWSNVKPVWDLVWAETQKKEAPVQEKKNQVLAGNPDRVTVFERVGKLDEHDLLDLLTVVKRDRYVPYIPQEGPTRIEKGQGNRDLYDAVSDALRYPRSIYQDKLALTRRLIDLKAKGKEGEAEAKGLEETIKHLDELARTLGQGEVLDAWAVHSHDTPFDLVGDDWNKSYAKSNALERKIFDEMDPGLKIKRDNGTAQNLQYVRKKAYIYERVSKLSSADQRQLLAYLTNLRHRSPDQEILYEAVQDAIFLPPLGKRITYTNGHAPTDDFEGKVFGLREMAKAMGEGNNQLAAGYSRFLQSIEGDREKAIGDHAGQPAPTAGTAEVKDAPGVRVINLQRYKRAAISGAEVRLRLSSDPNLDADVLEFLASVFHFSEIPKSEMLNMKLVADVDYLPKRERWPILNAYRQRLFQAFRDALEGKATPYDHLLKIGNLGKDKSKHELLAFALGALIRMVDRALIKNADWYSKVKAPLQFPVMDGDVRDYIALLARKPADTPEERHFQGQLAQLRRQFLGQPSEGRQKDELTAEYLVFHGDNTLQDFPPETVDALRRLPDFARELLVRAAVDGKVTVGALLNAARLVFNPSTEGIVGAAWKDRMLKSVMVNDVLMPKLNSAIKSKALPAMPNGIKLADVLNHLDDPTYEPPAELKDWLVRGLEGQVANADKQPGESFKFKDPAVAQALSAILQATDHSGHSPKAGELFARDNDPLDAARSIDTDVTSNLYVQEKKACDKADELQRFALQHFRALVKDKVKHDVGVEGRMKLCALGDPYIELMLLIEKKIPGLPGGAKDKAAEDLVALAQNASPEAVMKAGLAYAPDAADYINSLPLEDYLRKAIIGELIEKATKIGEKGELKPIELSAGAKSKLKLLTHLATMRLAGEALLKSQDPQTQQAYQKLFHRLGPQIELELRRDAALKMMGKAQDAVKAAKDKPTKEAALQALLNMSRGLHNGVNSLVLPSARLLPECAKDPSNPALLQRCFAEEMSFLTTELARQDDFNGHLGEYLDARKRQALQAALGLLGVPPTAVGVNPVVGLIRPDIGHSDKVAKARQKYEDHLTELMGDTELELRADAAWYRDALRQVASTEAWVETLKQIIPGEEADYKRMIKESGRSEDDDLKKPEFREKKHRLERLKKDLEDSKKRLAKEKENLEQVKGIYDSVNSSTKDNLKQIAQEVQTLLADEAGEHQANLEQLYKHLGGDYLLYRLDKRQTELKARKDALQKQADALRAQNKPVPAEIQDEIGNLNLLSQNIGALQTRLRAASQNSRLGPRAFQPSDDTPADSHLAAAGDRFRKFEEVKDRGVKLARALILPSNATDAAHLDDPEARKRFLADIKSDPATRRLYEGWVKDLHDEFKLDESHAQDLFLDYVRSVHPEEIASRDNSCKTKIEALEAKYGMQWNGYMFDMTKAHLYHQKGDHTESITPAEIATLEKDMRATKDCSSQKIDPWEAFRFELLQKFDSLGYPIMYKFGDNMAVSVQIDRHNHEHFQFISLDDAKKQAQATVDDTMKLWKELKGLRVKLNAMINNPAYPIAQGMKFMGFCLEAAWNDYDGKTSSRKWDERDPLTQTLKRLNEILTKLGKNIGKLGSYGDVEVKYPREFPTDREDARDFRKVTSYSAATDLTVQLGLLFKDEQDFREGVRDDLIAGAEASVKLLLAIYVTRGLGEVAEAGWGSKMMQTATQELYQTAVSVRNGGLLTYGGAWVQHFMDDPAHPSFRWAQYNQSQDQTMILFGAAHPITRVLGLVKWLKPVAGMIGFGAAGAGTEYFMGNPNHIWEHALRSSLYATPIDKMPGLNGGIDAFLASFLFNTSLDAGFTYHEYQKMKEDAERDGMPLPPLETVMAKDLKHGAIMNAYFAGMVGLNAGEEKRIEKIKELGHEGRTLEEVARSLEPTRAQKTKLLAENAFRKARGLPPKPIPTGMDRVKELMSRMSMSELKQMADEAVHNPEKAKAIEKVFGVPAERLAEILGKKLTPWWNPIGPNGDPAMSHLPKLRAEVAKSMAARIADPKTPVKERDKLILEFLHVMPDQAYEHLPAFHLDEGLSRTILEKNFRNATPGVIGEFLNFYKALDHNQSDTLSDYVAYFDTRDPAVVRKLLSEGRMSVTDAHRFFNKGLVDEAVRGVQVDDVDKISDRAQHGGTQARTDAADLMKAVAQARGVNPDHFSTSYRALMAPGEGDAALPVSEFAGKPAGVREKTLAALTREMSSTEANGFRRFVEEASKRPGDRAKTIAQLAVEYRHRVDSERAAVLGGHTPVASVKGRPEAYSDILLQELRLGDPVLGPKHEAILRQVAEDLGLNPESLLDAATKAPKPEMSLRRFAEALKARQQAFVHTGLPDEAHSIYVSEPWVYEQLGVGNFKLSGNTGHQTVVREFLAAHDLKGDEEVRDFTKFVLDYKRRVLHLTDDKQADVGPNLEHMIALYLEPERNARHLLDRMEGKLENGDREKVRGLRRAGNGRWALKTLSEWTGIPKEVLEPTLHDYALELKNGEEPTRERVKERLDRLAVPHFRELAEQAKDPVHQRDIARGLATRVDSPADIAELEKLPLNAVGREMDYDFKKERFVPHDSKFYLAIKKVAEHHGFEPDHFFTYLERLGAVSDKVTLADAVGAYPGSRAKADPAKVRDLIMKDQISWHIMHQLYDSDFLKTKVLPSFTVVDLAWMMQEPGKARGYDEYVWHDTLVYMGFRNKDAAINQPSLKDDVFKSIFWKYYRGERGDKGELDDYRDPALAALRHKKSLGEARREIWALYHTLQQTDPGNYPSLGSL